MTLPNFLIIGAAKSGTSSLWSYLRQHPQIYLPTKKEPNFFAFEGHELDFKGPGDAATIYNRIYKYSVTDRNSYLALFDGVTTETAIGEASVRYLYYPQSVENIAQNLPGVKMIVILRNPIERLYSHYCMNAWTFGLEPLTLQQALAAEPERRQQHWGWDWHYVGIGMYYQQLKRYYQRFEPHQIRVFLYEDFLHSPLKILQEIYAYLGVDADFQADMSHKSKVAYWPQSRWAYQLLSQPNPFKSSLRRILPKTTFKNVINKAIALNQRAVPPLEPAIRADLQEVFREDIAKLAQLIDRDLTRWLSNH